MKVCTDSCAFGALIKIDASFKNGLDIGTGTGLLSLMLAQKSELLNIDALEIENNSYLQAKDNCNNSIFKKQISILNIDFFKYQSDKKYEIIVCNPPFYKQQVPTKNTSNNLARHNDEFNFDLFFKHCFELSTEHAQLCLLIPFYRKQELIDFANKNNWYILSTIHLKNKVNQTPIRCIFTFTKNKTNNISEKDIAIYDSNNQYTEAFKLLMQPYYLDK